MAMAVVGGGGRYRCALTLPPNSSEKEMQRVATVIETNFQYNPPRHGKAWMTDLRISNYSGVQ